jgi:Mrp family chromosome partitioning ATPase
VPLLLSIPYTRARARLLLQNKSDGAGKELQPYRNGNGNGASVAPWDIGHFMRPYCESIRDRLGLYFELNNLTHKPKLVGVASFSSGAGTSTLAAGLAAALSEADEGKVLLVDVNLGPEAVHPFFQGKPAYSLTTALQPSEPMDPAAENLYLAKVGPGRTGPAQLGLKRFFDLMPNLKASDFDYIIFDMPPLAQTSPTWALSPFMDKMLLVVQSETTNKRRGQTRV